MLYEAACLKILQVTLSFVKFSFKHQMYLLSWVLCLLFALEENLGRQNDGKMLGETVHSHC